MLFIWGGKETTEARTTGVIFSIMPFRACSTGCIYSDRRALNHNFSLDWYILANYFHMNLQFPYSLSAEKVQTDANQTMMLLEDLPAQTIYLPASAQLKKGGSCKEDQEKGGTERIPSCAAVSFQNTQSNHYSPPYLPEIPVQAHGPTSQDNATELGMIGFVLFLES